ncbi:MAG: thiol-disulfide isomerase/thioredoxin, partial [Candidatus Azotimanducaceae bacterium]
MESKLGYTVPPFSLQNALGENVSFPGSRVSLTCFIKEDCPTCREVMPVLAQLHAAFADTMDIHIVGQTAAGNAKLESDFQPPFSLLDDSTLKVSFASDIDTVPTLVYSDANGKSQESLIGFVRQEWQDLTERLAKENNSSQVDLEWQTLPEWRPGCGSLSVDPTIADRLQAEAENSPLRARRIDIGQADDEVEFMFDQGFSDGLPLVPPTPERVLRMLAGTRRDPQEVLAVMPPNMGEVTVEKVAIN